MMIQPLIVDIKIHCDGCGNNMIDNDNKQVYGLVFKDASFKVCLTCYFDPDVIVNLFKRSKENENTKKT